MSPSPPPFSQGDLPDIDEHVGIDHGGEAFILTDPAGIKRSVPFDDVQRRIERYATELLMDPIPNPPRGTLTAYDTLRNLQDALRLRYEATGEVSASDLSPLLIGLEGQRVRVRTHDGEERRFVVGKSEGWLPHHVEIREDGPPVRADADYADVFDYVQPPDAS